MASSIYIDAMRRMTLVCALLFGSVTGCGGSPSTPSAGPDPVALRTAADTVSPLIRFKEIRPAAQLAPCELVPTGSAVNGVSIADDQRRTGKTFDLNAEFALKGEEAGSGVVVTITPLPKDTDTLLTDIGAAGQNCGKRTINKVGTMDLKQGILSAEVVTSAELREETEMVVVTKDVEPTPPPQSQWTVGSDGKLSPPADFDPKKPGVHPIPFAQAVLFATHGKVMVQVTVSAYATRDGKDLDAFVLKEADELLAKLRKALPAS